VNNEQVLAEAVLTWVDLTAPGNWGVAERATQVALSCYREGSTVGEACRRANGFVESWSHHPAHMDADRDVVFRLIS